MSQFASKDDLLAAQAARIAELEAQLEAIGAGGVEPLRKQAAAPQAVQAAVPVAWRLTNTAFRKPRFEYHDTKESAEQRQADFNRSVDDGGLHNLTPLYAAPVHPAEGVPAQAGPVGYVALAALTSRTHADDYAKCFATEAALLENYPAAKAIAVFDHAATQPAAQGMEQFIESQHKLAAMTARAEHAEAKLDAKAFEAEAYRWLRDEHDWHAEPRLDAEDGTVWKLTMYSPQEIIDPTDDDNLDAAIRAAIAAQAKQGG